MDNDGWESVSMSNPQVLIMWKKLVPVLYVIAQSKKQFSALGAYLRMHKSDCAENLVRLCDK